MRRLPRDSEKREGKIVAAPLRTALDSEASAGSTAEELKSASDGSYSLSHPCPSGRRLPPIAAGAPQQFISNSQMLRNLAASASGEAAGRHCRTGISLGIVAGCCRFPRRRDSVRFIRELGVHPNALPKSVRASNDHHLQPDARSRLDPGWSTAADASSEVLGSPRNCCMKVLFELNP